MMRQIILEFPLDTMPPGLVPEELLSIAPSIRFLRLDVDGFLFICRVDQELSEETIRSLKKHYRHAQRGTVKVTDEGQGTILVNGAWVRNGEYLWDDERDYLSQDKEFAKLMAIYQSRTCFLRSPEITENRFRLNLVGDPKSLRMLERTLGDVGLPYRVIKVSGLKKSTGSAFDRLTLQQMRIIRLAYAEGYYSVPRKISTERLAQLLEMEKGNVGEHLRRAEKNIMDFLMTM